MKETPKAKTVLSLHTDGSTTKAVHLRSSSKKIELIEATICLTPNEKTSFKELIERKIRQDPSLLIVSMLNAHQVLVRPLNLELNKTADIDQVLRFQAEPLIPYPVEEAIIARYIVSTDEEGSTLSVLAARKDAVSTHLQAMKNDGIEPESTTCEPAALAAFAAEYCKEQDRAGRVIIVNINNTHTVCTLSVAGAVSAVRSFDKGVESFNPTDTSTAQSYRQHLNQHILALIKQQSEGDTIPLLFTGEESSNRTLIQFLCEQTGAQETFIENRIGNDREQLLRFAAAIGASLPCLSSVNTHTPLEQVNFRQGEHAYPHRWKRVKNDLITFFTLSCLLALSCFIAGQLWIANGEKQVKKEYHTLLSVLQKTTQEFEKDYQSRTKSKKEKFKPLPITEMSLNAIEKRVSFLDTQLKKTPEGFPLLPNVPRVSDVLAWLATHPKVIKDHSPLLDIQSIAYTMVKRPDDTRKNEKYQIRVDIEFTSEKAQFAREFHDALIESNPFVNAKESVKWTYNRGRYRASFLLKDKTTYPSGAKNRA